MPAVTVHTTKPLAASLLAVLKKAGIELREVSDMDETFNHLHSLTSEQEEAAFREASRTNQQRFWQGKSRSL